jgi:hypothetical protein
VAQENLQKTDTSFQQKIQSKFQRWQTSFVWVTWALMFLGALGFVRHYGYNVPRWDEWHAVPALTGNQKLDFTYLWSLHNEHRIPLPKVVLRILGKITHGDSRAGMYFNVIAMAGLALVYAQSMAPPRRRPIGAWTPRFPGWRGCHDGC